MKTLLITTLLAGAADLSTGCATPGHSGGLPSIKFPHERATGENANNVLRTWALENRMMIDDINSALLIDEPTRLTKWHVR
jgi:hypothetical protein